MINILSPTEISPVAYRYKSLETYMHNHGSCRPTFTETATILFLYTNFEPNQSFLVHKENAKFVYTNYFNQQFIEDLPTNGIWAEYVATLVNF